MHFTPSPPVRAVPLNVDKQRIDNCFQWGPKKR